MFAPCFCKKQQADVNKGSTFQSNFSINKKKNESKQW